MSGSLHAKSHRSFGLSYQALIRSSLSSSTTDIGDQTNYFLTYEKGEWQFVVEVGQQVQKERSGSLSVQTSLSDVAGWARWIPYPYDKWRRFYSMGLGAQHKTVNIQLAQAPAKQASELGLSPGFGVGFTGESFRDVILGTELRFVVDPYQKLAVNLEWGAWCGIGF